MQVIISTVLIGMGYGMVTAPAAASDPISTVVFAAASSVVGIAVWIFS